MGFHVYYPFGEEATALQEGQRMKFTGHERDLGDAAGAGDDLDYMHARFCSPMTGRFLAVDPANDWRKSLPHSANRFSYVRGNPLRNIDPDGRVVETLWDLASVGIGIVSLASNVRAGEYKAAILDGAGIVVDGLATLVPLVPGGAGVAIKAGRVAGKVDEFVDASRISSRYEDITKGKSITNILTDTTKADFGANLEKSGFVKSVSKDGKATIYTKGDAQYVVRDQSNQNQATADFFKEGQLKIKIRLGSNQAPQ